MSEKIFYAIRKPDGEVLSYILAGTEKKAWSTFTVGRCGGYGNDITEARLKKYWKEWQEQGYSIVELREVYERNKNTRAN